MAKNSNGRADAPTRTRTLISQAYEGDSPPGALSVGIVSLVELCQLAMPDPAKIRERLREAEFDVGRRKGPMKRGGCWRLNQIWSIQAFAT